MLIILWTFAKLKIPTRLHITKPDHPGRTRPGHSEVMEAKSCRRYLELTDYKL